MRPQVVRERAAGENRANGPNRDWAPRHTAGSAERCEFPRDRTQFRRRTYAVKLIQPKNLGRSSGVRPHCSARTKPLSPRGRGRTAETLRRAFSARTKPKSRRPDDHLLPLVRPRLEGETRGRLDSPLAHEGHSVATRRPPVQARSASEGSPAEPRHVGYGSGPREIHPRLRFGLVSGGLADRRASPNPPHEPARITPSTEHRSGSTY